MNSNLKVYLNQIGTTQLCIPHASVLTISQAYYSFVCNSRWGFCSGFAKRYLVLLLESFCESCRFFLVQVLVLVPNIRLKSSAQSIHASNSQIRNRFDQFYFFSVNRFDQFYFFSYVTVTGHDLFFFFF